MITLCGFAVSNYFNKVKIALLEKNIPFTEETVMTKSKDEAVLSASPLAKIPFIRTEQGTLCESAVIMDYLEAAYPAPALMPAEPFDAAKLREISTFIELHLELVARELYAEAFFGGKVSDDTKTTVRRQLEKNIAGFKRLAKFAPYVGGDTFTAADCSAYVNLPLVGSASKIIYGEDLLVEAGVDYKAYMKLVGERPTVQKVNADRKAALAKA
ncbi:MAG: glutathione S-transferase [Betaproteobacteria bacterium]|jgi:glutathione S-transferase|nr:glutathione S-transferase [Betaproteobacteria bacterium]MBK7655549.1 glutathione S-transferase [Betaproteobacteria bacterium]MBP6646175.1 glutathione S-transferase [Burkholderiaceae bacterium]